MKSYRSLQKIALKNDELIDSEADKSSFFDLSASTEKSNLWMN